MRMQGYSATQPCPHERWCQSYGTKPDLDGVERPHCTHVHSELHSTIEDGALRREEDPWARAATPLQMRKTPILSTEDQD